MNDARLRPVISYETRQTFIKAIEEAFPESGFDEEHDKSYTGVVWERDDLVAGAAINSNEAWVFFADQTTPADSAETAIGLLSAIFADEIVAVAAYEGDVWIAGALANASDLHRAPHLLVPLDPRQIARVNKLDVRSWTGTLDGSRVWPPNDGER